MVEHFVLQSLNELRHEKGYLLVRELRKLLNGKQSHLYIAKLTIEQRKRLFWSHFFSERGGLEYLVAILELLLVSEINQSYVDWQLVDVVSVFQNFINFRIYFFSFCFINILEWIRI